MNKPLDGRHHNLPPELLVAPQEFDVWSQAQLLIEQSQSTPSEPVYHYTGLDAEETFTIVGSK
jgi:hypothetical protein